MADARGEEAWNHTSQLLSLTFNVNRDAKKERARSPADFNPYTTKAASDAQAIENMGEIKHLFVPK